LQVLLVISADDASVAHPSGLRKDYRVLAETLGADLVDRSHVQRSSIAKRLARFVGIAPAQAWLAWQKRSAYDVILTDGEHIGIPLALLLKLSRSKVAHLTIGHRITAAKKRPFFKVLKAHAQISCIVVHSRRQYDLAIRELGIPPERLALIPYQVDVDFWRPESVPEERLICSAGLEFRDYPTLVQAVDGLDVKLVIGAASHWSRRKDSTQDVGLPENVQVAAFGYQALRRLYARSAIVIVPLDDVDFQAGVTTILEAMAMGKPVIVTHSLGQTDVVEDRRAATRGAQPRIRPVSLLRAFAVSAGLALEPTGFYVLPRDPQALRRAILHLLDHPVERRKLGQSARRTVESLLTVDQFAARVRQLVVAAAAGRVASSAGRTVSLAFGE
jgi:glycosyltransferase involved in cell wall biosynthesis